MNAQDSGTGRASLIHAEGLVTFAKILLTWNPDITPIILLPHACTMFSF